MELALQSIAAKPVADLNLEAPATPVGSGFLVHLKRQVLEGLPEVRRRSEQGSYQKSCSIGLRTC
jgi:hypothetical protein